MVAGEGEGLADLVGALAACLNCFAGLWGFLVGLLFPAVAIRLASTGQFMSAFQFGEVFGIITSNIGNYIIALLLTWVASFIAQFGIIACGIGLLFTWFWSSLVQGHLFGQVGRQAQAAPTF